MVTVGEKAPAFELQDQSGETVSLSQYGGRWVVLYFYPRDDTPGCTKEACEFSADLQRFGELDAVVLGCSPDTPERQPRVHREVWTAPDAAVGSRTHGNAGVRRLG